MTKVQAVVLICVAALVLTACQTPTEKAVEDSTDAVRNEVDETVQDIQNRADESVVLTQGGKEMVKDSAVESGEAMEADVATKEEAVMEKIDAMEDVQYP